jgi:hypothetical protein
MKSKIPKYAVSFILVLILMIPFLTIGQPFRLALLPDKGANFGCGTCHISPSGGGPRNPFGRDWESIAIPQGDKYVAALASKDSDGDGFTNDEEFDANTHPGDPNSKPEPPKSVSPKGKKHSSWGKVKSGALD